MTPQSMLGQGMPTMPGAGGDGGQGMSYNDLSSIAPPQVEAPQTAPQASPSENLLSRFDPVFTQLTGLFDTYPGAEKEARDVAQSIYNWLDKAMASLNEGAASNPAAGQY